jgi:hypothetical protein
MDGKIRSSSEEKFLNGWKDSKQGWTEVHE